MASRIITLPHREIDDLYRRFVDVLERRLDDPLLDSDVVVRRSL